MSVTSSVWGQRLTLVLRRIVQCCARHLDRPEIESICYDAEVARQVEAFWLVLAMTASSRETSSMMSWRVTEGTVTASTFGTGNLAMYPAASAAPKRLCFVCGPQAKHNVIVQMKM